MGDQHHWDTMTTHQVLSGLSDNPRQFRGVSPSVRLMEQAHRAWREQRFGDSTMDYMRVPF
ncbi:hypothetical protein [Mycobacterium colombiense]|uniref:hypothetical protein n=1 Tax=Mycobacterium colombiense TaxID=339268 RepID=UPI00096FA619|nr:hypothetical protein [Mycobacterium colombiense]OMB93218.1 hypothetical protein A5732_16845 [Mycobacterium colombiense]